MLRPFVPGALVPIGLLGLLAGCQPAAKTVSASSPKEKPAKVSAPVKEDQLATVTLTPEAEARLGVQTVPAERRSIARTRAAFGDVTIPPGRTVPVSAPVMGTLKAPGGGLPRPGSRVKRGQPVFVLVPFLSPEARATLATTLATAEGQVKTNQEQVKGAGIALERARDLLRKKLGSSAAVTDAEVTLHVAQANLKAAEDSRDELARAAAGTIKEIALKAPADGLLSKINAEVDQQVTAGSPLFEVVDLSTVWIRVPVYVGDLDAIATDREAGVGSLSDIRGYDTRPARPVEAPLSADPLAVTADLYYQVANAHDALRPGQRVGVMLPLRGEQEGLVVPRSALLVDIHGGEWVYESTGSHTFARRRVEVDRVLGSVAILARGPKPGAKIVTTGAAELYGAEFGGSK